MSAPLRITRVPATPAPATKAAPAPPSGDMRAYLDRLVKMIPAETISLYLVGIGVIPAASSATMGWVWLAVCLLAVLVVRVWGTADPEKKLSPDWVHVAISIVAFLIWAFTQKGPFQPYYEQAPFIGSLLVLIWTFFIPFLYHGPKEQA